MNKGRKDNRNRDDRREGQVIGGGENSTGNKERLDNGRNRCEGGKEGNGENSEKH